MYKKISAFLISGAVFGVVGLQGVGDSRVQDDRIEEILQRVCRIEDSVLQQQQDARVSQPSSRYRVLLHMTYGALLLSVPISIGYLVWLVHTGALTDSLMGHSYDYMFQYVQSLAKEHPKITSVATWTGGCVAGVGRMAYGMGKKIGVFGGT